MTTVVEIRAYLGGTGGLFSGLEQKTVAYGFYAVSFLSSRLKTLILDNSIRLWLQDFVQAHGEDLAHRLLDGVDFLGTNQE
jgi:hypothetical protein